MSTQISKLPVNKDYKNKSDDSILKLIWVLITHPITDHTLTFLDGFGILLIFELMLQAMVLFLRRKLLFDHQKIAAVSISYGFTIICTFVMAFL